MGEKRVAYSVLMGKYEGKRVLGRPNHRWEDNIKMYLYEVGCGGMNCIDLVHNGGRWWTLVIAVINPRVP
jgi:hypothetical protein